jgi:glycosyltransferase involved in cell wall biosynthesis
MDDPVAGARGGPPRGGVPSVAVLVELDRSPEAGGHVKCWEHFAQAAAALDPARLGVDLTVYVLGDAPRVQLLSADVRFVSLRPMLSTRPFVRRVGTTHVTDLAPYHPALARLLPRHDVWHLTHSFAFSATATRLALRHRRRGAGRWGPGLVASVHTDVPDLAAAYARGVCEALPLPAAAVPDAPVALALRRMRDRMLRSCDLVLVGTPAQRAEIADVVGEERVGMLGRGIDRERFRPDPGARAALSAEFGVPGEGVRVLFVGRVDSSKRVGVLGEAVHRLRAERSPVHLVVAGDGVGTRRLTALLGPHVTLLGILPQQRLATVFAGCDVFAFPSRTETVGNVVAEAMASGLPVLLPAGARTTGWLARPGADGLEVRRDDAAGWAAALRRLVEDPALRTALGAAARATARRRHRSWEEVLTQDLLPVWGRLAPSRPLPRRTEGPPPAASVLR